MTGILCQFHGRKINDQKNEESITHEHVTEVDSNNERRIKFVFILTLSDAVIQAVGDAISGSLALIAGQGIQQP